ncbi:MAG: DUF4282 domain-containing protein [bacterium]|nr:DUF4282 domain-containing protein [bacterium]
MEEYSWFVAKDRQQVDGEFSTADVLGMMDDSPKSSFMVWRAGMDTWVSPDTLPEFVSETEQTRALEAQVAEVPEAPEEPEVMEEDESEPELAAPEGDLELGTEPSMQEPEPAPALELEPEAEVLDAAIEPEGTESADQAPTQVEEPSPESLARPTMAAPVDPALRKKPIRPARAPRKAAPRSAGIVSTLKGLLDFRFETMIGRDVIRVVYLLLTVVIGFALAGMLVSGLGSIIAGLRFSSASGVIIGLLTLLGAPILAAVELALIRVGLEVVIVLFKIHDNTTALADRVEKIEKNAQLDS